MAALSVSCTAAGSGGTTALIGADGITVISGSPLTTISGFRDEFVAASGHLQSQIGGGGVTDHGALTGLEDDDHPQYVLVEDLASTTSGSPGTALVGFPTVSGFASPAGGGIVPTVEVAQTLFFSAGHVSGGLLTDNGDETIAVSSGIGGVRTGNSNSDQLVAFGWGAVPSIPVPVGTICFVGISYDADADTATIATKLTDNWNYFTEFPLGFVSNRNNILHVISAPHVVGDQPNLVIRRLDALQGLVRDAKVGGLIIGETGVRNVTHSAGRIWKNLNFFDLVAQDTNAGDTFAAYYRDGVGGFTLVAAETQWDNTSYDDGSGTLVPLSNNRRAVLWFYEDVDGDFSMIYGRGQYTNLALAEAEAAPNTLPIGFPEETILLGRFIFQEGNATTEEIQSAFVTTFATVGISDHGNLIGLLDDDHTQYVLADGTRGFSATVSGADPVGSDDLSTKNYVDSEILTVSGELSSEIDSDITTHAAISDAHHTRYTKDETDAIIGSDGITIVSGVDTIDVQGFRAEFLSASGTFVEKTGDTMTGDLVMDFNANASPQIIAASGTLDRPGLAIGDVNNGIASVASGSLNLLPGDGGGMTLNKAVTLSLAPFSVAVGSAAVPSYSIFGNPFTGMYGIVPDHLRFSSDGVDVFRIAPAFAGFDTTVSGLDPVEPFDFVTKSYLDSDIGVGPFRSKTLVVEVPTTSENLSFFHTVSPVTVTGIKANLLGTPSSDIDWTIRHAATRSDTGTEVITGGSTTALGEQAQITIFNNPTITGGSHIWAETTDSNGTPTELAITIIF